MTTGRSIGILAIAVLVACTSTAESTEIELPPVDGGLDEQLSGAYPPAAGVDIVVRDRRDPPSPGHYSICYVNAFQTQPDEDDWWQTEHPELVLHDADGEAVVDPNWPGEHLLAVGEPNHRDALVAIVGPWIDGCADAGYDAVELDNLDTFARVPDLIDQRGAVAYATALAARAHRAGLAVAQKNAPELVGRREEIGFDLAVAESCGDFDECDAYVTAYGDAVLLVEYDRAAFERACRAHPGLPIVLRDLGLVTPADPGYVFDTC